MGRLILLSALPVAAAPAAAGAWHQAVSLPLALEYDSNPKLAPTGEAAVWRSRFSPAYDLTGTIGVDEFHLGATLNVERSTDTSLSGNRQDPKLTADWRHLTETGEIGVAAEYAEASTRVTELAESGLVTVDGTRTTKSLGAHWRSAVSERAVVDTSLDYKDVAYERDAYTDYTTLSGAVSYTYSWSERAQPFLRVTASHYEPADAVVQSSDNYGALLGLKWRAAGALDLTAQLGATQTAGAADDSGWQGGVMVYYTGERAELAVDLGRYVTPTGEGGFAESDQMKGSIEYAISERTKLGLEISWRDYHGNTPNTVKQIEVHVGMEMTPFWRARLFCQHTQRDENGAGTAAATVVGMMLAYTHPDF